MHDQPFLSATSLLKSPRQERSIHTVHILLDSTWELMTKLGYQKLSTNEIARHAKVNIASVYQYFGNKDAMISAAIERYLLAYESDLRNAVIAMHSSSPQEIVLKFMRLIQPVLESHRAPLRDVLTNMPVFSRNSLLAFVERIVLDAVTEYVDRNSSRIRIDGGKVALYIAINSAIFVMAKWLVDDVRFIDADDFQIALAKQVVSCVEIG